MNEQLRPIPLRADPRLLALRNVASLVRAVIALAIGKLENRGDERSILKNRWPEDTIAPLILRAATAPNMLAGTPALAQTIVADVIATLGPQNAGARLLQSGLQLQFDRYATILVPSVQALSTQSSFVGEGAPIPIHNLTTAAASLVPRKIGTGVVLTREMLEASNSQAIVTDVLLRSVALAFDVIITFGYPPALVAKTLAQDIPIVCTGAGDPVATGLAQSLARPGGNLTGVTELAAELSAKRLEILKEAVPNLKKAAMLFNAADLGMTLRSRAAEAAAKVLNVSVQSLGVREPSDFGDAFAEMTRSPPDAILMVSDTLTGLNRKLVMEFAANNRLPAMYEFGYLVRDGGLMSYGPNLRETGKIVGDLVARILRGARPADLPLEQPTHFEFIVNLKTAKSIGFIFPPALLARADEAIE
jgi:putative ABC transport system substrate-binding protein